ncbi:hypothetical protein R6Q59_004945 [Mikania micrantha]
MSINYSLISNVHCPKTIWLTRKDGIDFSQMLFSTKINRQYSPALKLSLPRTTTFATPFRKEFYNPLDKRNIILDGYGFRQRYEIRFYEAETQNITIQSIFNLLEETSWNYVRMFWVCDNESGHETPGMVKNDLRWVVSRMQLQIDEYPRR